MVVNLQKSVFIRALRRQAVPRTPVWMMRQAGRYLPEYRAIRESAGDFMTLCKTPELACEVTLQPLRRFRLDAAILFSDILTIPDAMGLGLHFVEGEGPRFERPLRTLDAMRRVAPPDPEMSLGYVMDAVRMIRRELPADMPLIGFSGSPWTLTCYMVEGAGSRDFRHTVSLLYSEPAAAQTLLQILADAVSAYLEAQIAAGADAVMIFDTWGGILTPEHYRVFSLDYMQQVVTRLKAVHPQVPVILFSKGASGSLGQMANTGVDALGLDWTCNLSDARSRVGHQVALQGNLNPAVLLTNETVIRRAVEAALADYGHGEGHVFNLGHGVTPDVLPAHVEAMVEAVHTYSPQYHPDVA